MLKENNYYSAEDMIELDRKRDFIPLTMDGLFKGIFKKNKMLLKEFILSQTNLKIDDDNCNIDILDSELVKDKENEYQKTVDVYVALNNLYVNIEINREYFKYVEKRNFAFAGKLYSSLLKRGDDVKSLDDKMFVQINLNAMDKYDKNNNKIKLCSDKVVYYGLNSDDKYLAECYIIYIKYLEYYRYLYYNGNEKLDKSYLWLVLLTSTSFLEMYKILGELFDDDKREQFIKDVIFMINEKDIISEWERDKWNEYIDYKSKQDVREKALTEGRNEGYEQGIEQGIENGKEKTSIEYILKMFEMNINIDDISKITNKTEEEILEIKNNFVNAEE